jgi:ATP-dependent 26S proteasome regulatory subunit
MSDVWASGYVCTDCTIKFSAGSSIEGTRKTLLARACAAQTKACDLKLAGPSPVQMVIGDGAKLVRDAFELAKEKAPAIIFIDELDAIGTKRFDSEKSGATMLELLNRLDGFSSDENIKVCFFFWRLFVCISSQLIVMIYILDPVGLY